MAQISSKITINHQVRISVFLNNILSFVNKLKNANEIQIERERSYKKSRAKKNLCSKEKKSYIELFIVNILFA